MNVFVARTNILIHADIGSLSSKSEVVFSPSKVFNLSEGEYYEVIIKESAKSKRHWDLFLEGSDGKIGEYVGVIRLPKGESVKGVNFTHSKLKRIEGNKIRLDFHMENYWSDEE